MRKTANIRVGELARHCIKRRVAALKTKSKHSYKQSTSPSCKLLAPPSGALIVSQFQDSIPGKVTIHGLRLRDSRDSRDSRETPETPKTPGLPRLRDSRGFCHITFQFSFISDLQQKNLLDVTQLENCSQCHPVSKFWAKLQFMV